MVVQIFLFVLSATIIKIEGKIYMAAFIIDAEAVAKEIFDIEGAEKSVQEEVVMTNRKRILDEVFELALQYDMNYFG